jgi:CDP-diacylglycerol--glycerol-3-phosphate 3-phosphatidyltransferase
LLLVSFLTDAVDGFLARKFKVASVLGAKLDSIGDDLTVLAAVVGLFYTRPVFIKEHWAGLIILLCIFLVQLALSLFRYKRISSFHTYLAKIAAVVSAIFLLSTFFMEEIYYPLFFLALCVTAVELIEEIVLVLLLPKWAVNVKGLYWVLKKKVPTKTTS